jgi:uncharacterized protein (DUF885 family)
MLRKYIPLIFLPLAAVLFLGIQFFPQHDFQDLTGEIFRYEMSSNTLNLHYTLADPRSYEIKEDPDDVTLGAFDRETLTEENTQLQNWQAQLSVISTESLSEGEQLTAQILNWWLDGQLLSEEYYEYQEPLSPTLGVQAQLPVLLAEFPFRTEEDILIYLNLLDEIPSYFAQIEKFEKEKSKQGLFMNMEIAEKIQEQCRSLLPVDQTHFLVTSFAERLENCDFLTEDQKIIYEVQNLRALNHSFVPAYENLCEVLEELKDTGINSYGLSYFPKGTEYYEYLLKYSIGTDLTTSQIQKLLEEQMDSDSETVLYAISQGINILDLDQEKAEEELKDPAAILTELEEKIQNDFPEIPDIAYEVKEVPDSLAEFLSPAFYMTPPIDEPQQNIIYINPSRSWDAIEQLTTLAHEGYPGHLYQNYYENQEDFDPVRNLFYIGGYTEGWGLYSELYAYDYLNCSSEEAAALRALASLNYALCASLDISIHCEGWTEEDCTDYLAAFGITDQSSIHSLYLNILEEPSNYLKYYLGYLQICKLKESALALSEDVTVYDFHKWFLEMGPAPFSILKQQLETFEISAELLHRTGENIELFTFESVHDGLNHPSVEFGVFPVGGDSFVRQREKNYPLVLCTADTGYISFLHQTVNGSG